MNANPLSRARAGTLVLFALTGLVFGTWAARIPAVQDRLQLSAGSLALVLAAIEGGAVLGLPAGGVLVARAGSAACLRMSFVVYSAGLVGVGLAPSLAALVPTVAVWAAANSVIDVALNAQGVELERRYRRPVLPGLHAGHSIGLLAGALGAVAATAAATPLLAHLGGVAAVTVAAALVATPRLVAEPRVGPGGLRVRPNRRLLLLAAVGFCAFALEGAGNSWSAVQLSVDHHAGPVLAAAGYAGFAAAVALGRLAGDGLLARYGRTRVVTAGGALAAGAVALVVLAPAAPVALGGWALLGLAVAPLAPAVLGAAPTVAGMPAATAVAAISTLGYLGSFTGPPLVGLLASVTSVSFALVALLPAALVVAVLARPALGPRSTPAPDPPGGSRPTAPAPTSSRRTLCSCPPAGRRQGCSCGAQVS